MKATELLETQHRKMEDLFSELEDGRSNLLEELANNLAAHMTIEQEIFYPAVSSINSSTIAESFEEHAIAEMSLKRLLNTKPEEESFSARLSVLKELVRLHVHEEEAELFPEVDQDLAEARLAELGEQMKARFDEAMDEGYERLLPGGFDETSSDRALTGDGTGRDEPARERAGRTAHKAKGSLRKRTHRKRSASARSHR